MIEKGTSQINKEEIEDVNREIRELFYHWEELAEEDYQQGFIEDVLKEREEDN